MTTEQSLPDLDSLRDDPLAWLEAIGEHADLYQLTLNLTKQGGSWRVRQAIMERFTGMGFDTR